MAASAAPLGRKNPGPSRLLKTMDTRTIAARLSLPEDVVRAVQRHGVLQRLDLDNAEIRERLWRAHLLWQSSGSDVPREEKRA